MLSEVIRLRSAKWILYLLIVFAAVVGMTTAVFAREFPDVSQSTSCYDAVMKLSDLGVISGREDGKFDPDTQVTRAEFCAFLSRANGYSADYIVKQVPFPDVKVNYWAAGVISFSYESGFINGMEDGTFQPAAKVTAAQAIKMVVCAMGVGDSSLQAVGPMWYSGYWQAAEKAGFLSHLTLEANQPITRAQVAQVIYNSLDESRVIVPTPSPQPSQTPDGKPSVTPSPAPSESPVPPEKPKPVYRPKEGTPLVFVDAGHNSSGVDTGASGNDLREQDITVAIALKLKPVLERCGFEVMLSRNSDKDNVEGDTTKEVLERRAELANEVGAHYFVSIHCNSGGGTGIETYHFPGSEDGEEMAEAIQDALTEEFEELRDRGVKNEDFSVLRNTAMPAVLIETGFIDHSENDSVLLGSEEGQQRYAEAIAKGICAYTKSAYVK